MIYKNLRKEILKESRKRKKEKDMFKKLMEHIVDFYENYNVNPFIFQ